MTLDPQTQEEAAKATPASNFLHFRALQERVGKVQVALAALALTVAGLTAWQVTAQSTISDQGSRLDAASVKVAALEAQLADLAPEQGYELTGVLTSGEPTSHYTCAAWGANPGGEGYARCSYLGAERVGATSQPSVLVEAPESLRLMVYAKKIGG